MMHTFASICRARRVAPAIVLCFAAACSLVSGLRAADEKAGGAPAGDTGQPLGQPLGAAKARHLLARAGFGGDAAEVARFSSLSAEAAARELLAGMRSEPETAPPAWTREPGGEPKRRDMTEEERAEMRKKQRDEGEALKAWWLGEILQTSFPLTERMTLFWHNHFTSSLQKVKSPDFMARQNLLLRRHAKGNFGALLHEIARDPAMILYLDTQSNEKGTPNENFARELLELFTLGEGNYAERDVKEAARAFTGWKVARRKQDFALHRRLHDDGVKEFLGRRGPFDGDQIIDILLEQPQTAVHVTRKLWREFISPEPDPAEVERLAGIFRAGKYEIAPLLAALLSSEHFYAERNRGVLMKSPIDLIAGTLRQIPGTARDLPQLLRSARAMGQDLFDPPNVKGWPGGSIWITSSTLLLREQFLMRAILGGEEKGPRKRGPAGMAAADSVRDWYGGLGSSDAERAAKAQALLLPLP
ncbi:MAG: DUF1800 domain-containing protein, partial [Planctomycetes bacterium]|nr:DUF1800 domain-containing protein [Planctomycetota bacterium]